MGYGIFLWAIYKKGEAVKKEKSVNHFSRIPHLTLIKERRKGRLKGESESFYSKICQ